ncbi:MAG: T9SS type A sorting domain-containing protein [Saprospiraceae bacterium]
MNNNSNANPTINEVNVQLTWNGKNEQKDILAYNEAGELVCLFKQKLTPGNNNFTLDVSKLGNDIYDFLLVDKEQNLSLGKVIKVE